MTAAQASEPGDPMSARPTPALVREEFKDGVASWAAIESAEPATIYATVRTGGTLDLSFMRPGEHLWLTLDPPIESLAVQSLRSNASVTLVLSGAPTWGVARKGSEVAKLRDLSVLNCTGVVRVIRSTDSAASLSPAIRGTVAPSELRGELEFESRTPTLMVTSSPQIELDSFVGVVEVAGRLKRLELSDSVVTIRPAEAGRVDALVISGVVAIRGSLTVASLRYRQHAVLRYNHGVACQSLAAVFLEGESASLRVLSHSFSSPRAGEIGFMVDRLGDGVQIHLEDRLSMSVRGLSNAKLVLSGSGKLSLAEGCVLNELKVVGAPHRRKTKNSPRGRLALDDSTPAWPHLSLGPHAAVNTLSGCVRIETLRDARLTGALPGGFVFAGLVGKAEGALAGAIVENVTVPADGARLRAMWEQLGGASVVVPTLGAAMLTDFVGGGAGPESALRNDEQQRMLAAAAEAMATVAESRHAPGSIRTRARHSAYRMRQVTAPSRWERALLTVYRLIGFGERPAPPLTVWLLGSVVFAVAFNMERGLDLSPGGALRALTAWVEWLLPALSLLGYSKTEVGAGADDTSDFARALRFLAHSVLAVPFLTGVLALRNFVKSERGSA